MSNLGRTIQAMALALLVAISAGALSTPAHAGQISAVKDGWLVMKVHSEMVDEDVLAGADIDVDVDKGVVTLQGTVPSEAARSRAIAVAKANDGVKSVVDQLTVGSAAKREGAVSSAAKGTTGAANKTGRAVDDGWIKSKIYAQYLADWNTVLNDSDIDVDVKDNVVTLNGTVKSAEAKNKAVATAKATDGVKSVNDMLKVAGT